MTTSITALNSFAAAWDAWHEARIARLGEPYGWLSITGIQWLTGGSAVRVDGFPGAFSLREGGVLYEPEPGESVSLADTKKAIDAPTLLASPVDVESRRLFSGGLQVEVIHRDGAYALRVRDPRARTRLEFTDIDCFDPDPSWVVPVTFERFAEPAAETVGSVIDGLTHDKRVLGRFHFEIRGSSLALDAYDTAGGAPTIIFGDETSGSETYGGARFIYLGDPEHVGAIDFNRAVNPPCALSPFCTCPIASSRNRLKVRVEAGERCPSQ